MMEGYQEQELIYLYHMGSQIAYDTLLKIYKSKIESYASLRLVDTTWMGIDDYVQEALFTFYKTLDNYRFDKGAKVTTYFTYMIEDSFRSSRRTIAKHMQRDGVKIFSYDSVVNENMTYESILCDSSIKYQPASQLHLKEEMNYYQGYINDNASSLEKQVLYYDMDGYKSEEIASMLNIDVKRVYNAHYRLQMKIKDDQKKWLCVNSGGPKE